MSMIQDFLGQRPSSSIFHYASAFAAINIISRKKIWASKIAHLNDSAEHSHAAKWIQEEIEVRDRPSGAISKALSNLSLYRSAPEESPSYFPMLKGLQPTLPTKPGRSWLKYAQEKKLVYVASFSEDGDSLSQWRAYCSQGNGYSLGFNASNFQGVPATGTSLVKCVYRDEEKRDLVKALVEDCEARDDGSDGSVWPIFLDILVVMASVKHESFEDEREWRLVSFGGSLAPLYRPGRHGIVPYVEIPYGREGELTLSDIWIGPNSDPNAALESIQSLVNAHNLESGMVKYNVSETPYRQ